MTGLPDLVESTRLGDAAVVTMRRGKVNALDGEMVARIREAFEVLREDASARAVVLTGQGAFFSFGLDVPELYPLPPESFASFLTSFTRLYRDLYVFPKPVVAAVNGHAIAGGCMLALACDRRFMTRGRAKISLNEITFGSSLFAGSVEMLRALVGQRDAERVALDGAMHTAEEALKIGLVDRVVSEDTLLEESVEEARRLAQQDGAAHAGIKGLLRASIVEQMDRLEAASIREFVEIWYSAGTREMLKGIRIRS